MSDPKSNDPIDPEIVDDVPSPNGPGAASTETGLLASAAGHLSALASSFIENASPREIIRIAELLKEARESENRANVAIENLEVKKQLAMRAMEQREAVIKLVASKRLDKSDRALDLLISKLGAADSPETITAIADAIAKVATTDRLSDLADVVSAIKVDDVDIEF